MFNDLWGPEAFDGFKEEEILMISKTDVGFKKRDFSGVVFGKKESKVRLELGILFAIFLPTERKYELNSSTIFFIVCSFKSLLYIVVGTSFLFLFPSISFIWFHIFLVLPFILSKTEE